MAERSSPPPQGVSLRQYATVLAGRADGLPLSELLAHAGVDARHWPKAEEAWGERLLDDLEADGPLEEELERHLGEALRSWARPLPPLDGDLRAWLDFERAWAHEADAGALLGRAGMRPIDMTRLQGLWAERFQNDPALTAEALAILAGEPGAPCTPAPEPARLPPRALPRAS